MALAKKCDRCGKLYEQKSMDILDQPTNGLATIDRYENNGQSRIRKYIDLCPTCLESFKFWLNISSRNLFLKNEYGIPIGKDYKEEANV